MEQIETIVAATDLSRSALDAARRAAHVARDRGARLELLHVIPHPFVSDSWNQVLFALKLDERHFREAAMQQLREQVQRIRADTGVSADIHVAEGKPFAEIAARALAVNADLLVVGAHGENALLDPFLGTTAHRVLRFARVPVLLARLSPTFAYQRALIATDFSDDAAEAARCARRLFQRLDMTLFHAYEVPFEGKLEHAGVSVEAIERYRHLAEEEARRSLAAFARAVELNEAIQALRRGPASLRIREVSRDTGADLIVLGAQGRGAMETALLGSVSLRLVTETPCDVLLARVAR
jgi:nucleotide-binding universal stress UspA family protein